MKMTAAITISSILAGLMLAVAGIFYTLNHHGLAFQYLIAGVFFSCLCIFLAVLQAARKNGLPERQSLAHDEDGRPHRTRRAKHGERFAFGVYWNTSLNPLCPVCETPLTLSTKNLIYPIDPFNDSIPPPQPIPHCLKCDEALPLYDDEGNEITLAEAKKLLSSKEPKTEPNALKAQDTKPQSQTTNIPQSAQTYEPDEIAIEILKQISKGIAYEGELGNVLKFERQQISSSLRLLEEYNYINLQRPTNRASYYQLTKKGTDELNKPNYKVPHSVGDAPNQTEVKILTLLAHPNCTPFLDSLSVDLQLHPDRLKYHLTELIKRDYVRANRFDDWGAARYELTHKARKFLIDNDLI